MPLSTLSPSASLLEPQLQIFTRPSGSGIKCLVAEGGEERQNSYRCGGVCNILIGDAYMHPSQS
ncbi:low molecular weight phosphotyrosine protein phosphatase [Aspergillus lentulus]|nr:low molecular weight phosphotyrosine protein phosphatase [Aspergillus lentulus]